MRQITSATKTPGGQLERKKRRRPRLLRRILFYLGIFGPGLIAANAGNDAGGIATYSSMGARLHHFAAAGTPPLARPNHGGLYGSIIRTLSWVRFIFLRRPLAGEGWWG